MLNFKTESITLSIMSNDIISHCIIEKEFEIGDYITEMLSQFDISDKGTDCLLCRIVVTNLQFIPPEKHIEYCYELYIQCIESYQLMSDNNIKTLIRIEHQGLTINYTPQAEKIISLNKLLNDIRNTIEILGDDVNKIREEYPQIKIMDNDFLPSELVYILDGIINGILT